jgi:small subunit ribosomal protein S1
MAEKDNTLKEDIDQTKLQEEYLKSLDQIEEGHLIKGSVIEKNSENVFVDIGYKSEGKIPMEEFDEKPEIGDTVDVLLIRKEGQEGQVIVSKRKADVKLFWKNLREAAQNGEPIEGTFSKNIKGGFEVDLGYGIKGFCPISKADISHIEKPEQYTDMKTHFLIERLYSDNKIKIILNRRDWQEKEIERRREEFFKNVSIGDEVEGTVKSFTSFGAFIDLGGFDGLLHINDMSWGHVTRPKDFVKKNQKVKLKVIRLDEEENKINLSLKHFTQDPWLSFEERYQEGDVVKGKVTKLADFGAFIELEEGIEGLAHISELSWVKRINHPKEVLTVGDEVEAKILSYDLQKGRVSLGLKQVYPNPWDTIDERYPEGSSVTCKINKITNSGAFAEIEEGIEGFVHIDDLSWTKKYRHPSAVLTEGKEYDFQVIEIDKQNRRIRLGMKQLTDDPWQALAKSCKPGNIIEGEITSKTDFGLFVKVQGGIEGLIHKNNLASKTEKEESPDELLEHYSVGDKVKAVVTEIDPSKQKLSLSIKDYQHKLQREELSKYIHDEEEEATVTVGDLLKNKDNSSKT